MIELHKPKLGSWKGKGKKNIGNCCYEPHFQMRVRLKEKLDLSASLVIDECHQTVRFKSTLL